MTIAQLEAAGLSEATVRARVMRGVLHRKYVGVYAVGHAKLSQEGEWMAGVLAAGDGAFLSHRSAAALSVIWNGPTRITEVLAPRGRRPKGPVLVRTYRRLDPADVTVRNGIPVTTVARTLVDLTDVLEAHDLANVIHEASYRGLFDLAETCAAMERANGRRNLKRLEAAIAIHLGGSAGTKSRAERLFRKLVKPEEPLGNVIVEGIEVDFLFPERRLVVEIDDPNHGRARSTREDALERRVLEAAGYTLLRFTNAEVETRPVYVLSRLRAGSR